METRLFHIVNSIVVSCSPTFNYSELTGTHQSEKVKCVKIYFHIYIACIPLCEFKGHRILYLSESYISSASENTHQNYNDQNKRSIRYKFLLYNYVGLGRSFISIKNFVQLVVKLLNFNKTIMLNLPGLEPKILKNALDSF